MVTMKMTRVWDILRKFKSFCQHLGWRTCENEDWVETDGGYHNFLWARDVHLSSFKRIITNGKCVIPEGSSYRVLRPAYSAWLFSDTPPETLIKTVLEDPDISSRIALYDLSPLFEGKNLCVRLNNTASTVFKEFEGFLRKEYGLKVNSLELTNVNEDAYTVPELA
jgi:hypothetical protein